MFLLKNQRECVIFVYFTGEYGYNVYICARRRIFSVLCGRDRYIQEEEKDENYTYFKGQ